MVKSFALIDSTGKYRYYLVREWDPVKPRVLYIMLNPSTADAIKDDPTIRRCIGLAKSWGYGSIEVVNLFAYRATNPKELYNTTDPVGPDNNKHIIEAIKRAKLVIAAWGTKGIILGREKQVRTLLASACHLYSLGLTKEGYPKHPLYIKGDTAPIIL